jgi:hypothetical protein
LEGGAGLKWIAAGIVSIRSSPRQAVPPFGGFERNRDGLLAGEGRILGGCRGASPAHMQAVWRQIPENLSD